MFEKLLLFLKHPTSKDIIINTVGNYINVFFSAFFILLFTRIFDKNQMGVFSVLFGIAYVLANILDFGTTATIYSYLPQLIEQKAAELYRLIKSTFFFQSLFSIIIVTSLMLGFPYLDSVFFKTGAPPYELYLTAISVLFFVWQNFLSNCLYSAKKVLQTNVYNLISNVLKTAIILIIAAFHKITVGWVLFTFGIVGPLIFYLFVFFEKRNHIKQVLAAPIHAKDFRFNYTMTSFISSQFFNLALRMDLFLLSYYLTKDIVGYYGLSQKIILTIIATIVSITQVISPAFSKINTQNEVRHHLKSAFLYMLIPTALYILLALTPTQLFVWFFTEKFMRTAEVSHVLAIPYIMYPIINIGYLLLLYTYKKPLLLLFGSFILFVVITAGCYVYIPILGYMAAVYSLGAGFAASGIYFLVLCIVLYRKLPRASSTSQVTVGAIQ